MPVKVNVRVVAATNRDLKQMATDGSFRDDLYYRLNVFPVDVPSLSQRRDDIKELVELFAAKYGSKISFSDKAMAKLVNHKWTGNIRELENTIYRICILMGSGEVQIADLPSEFTGNMAACMDMNLPEDELNMEELEISLIKKALNKFDGNKSKAAKYLCMQRHVLLYRLEKFGIS